MNDWTGRLRKLGMTQTQFAARLGVSPQAVRAGMANENGRYEAILEALEIMTAKQRREWLGQD